MRTYAILLILTLNPLMAFGQTGRDEVDTLGKWRLFPTDRDVTAILASSDGSADMDLFCDKTHLEASVYLKKRPEQGALIKFQAYAAGSLIAEGGWQVNARTRSITVKTESPAFFKALSQHKNLVFSYALENKAQADIAFDLGEVNTVMERLNAVCQLDRSQYE